MISEVFVEPRIDWIRQILTIEQRAHLWHSILMSPCRQISKTSTWAREDETALLSWDPTVRRGKEFPPPTYAQSRMTWWGSTALLDTNRINPMLHWMCKRLSEKRPELPVSINLATTSCALYRVSSLSRAILLTRGLFGTWVAKERLAWHCTAAWCMWCFDNIANCLPPQQSWTNCPTSNH